MRSSGMHFLRRRRMPETSSYYHVAYTVALTIYAFYGASLYLRRKRLRRK